MDVRTSDIPAVADDNIPGVMLPSGTITDSLDWDVDYHDVYCFYLEKGAKVHFALTGIPGTDFTTGLWGPTAVDVDSDVGLIGYLQSTGTYPLNGVYTSPVSAIYYVDVYDNEGYGGYSLDWSIDPASNNAVPGDPLPASPVLGWMDSAYRDAHDVYSVVLNAGDTLSLNLEGDAAQSSDGFDMNVDVLGPGSLAMGAVSSHNPGSSERIWYPVSVPGQYYIDVSGYDGWGPSALSWSVTPRMIPSLSRSPGGSKVTARRKKGKARFTLKATLSGGGWLLTGYPVYLQQSKNGKSGWKTVSRASTGADGVAVRTGTVRKAGTYYFRWYAPAQMNTNTVYTSKQRVVVK